MKTFIASSSSGLRLKNVDADRGIAAIAVVLYHYLLNYNVVYGHSFEVSDYWHLGGYGVDLFFIISGFVIYKTIEKKIISLHLFTQGLRV